MALSPGSGFPPGAAERHPASFPPSIHTAVKEYLKAVEYFMMAIKHEKVCYPDGKVLALRRET